MPNFRHIKNPYVLKIQNLAVKASDVVIFCLLRPNNLKINCVLKSTYVYKSAMLKIVLKYIVGKYTVISIRKVQLSYFHGEKRILRQKISVSHTKIYELSEEKFLIFPM